MLYTLLSPSITFSQFHSELKLFRKSYPIPVPPQSVSISGTDIMALYVLRDFCAYRFYALVLFFLISAIRHMRQVDQLSLQVLGARLCTAIVIIYYHYVVPWYTYCVCRYLS